jgi:hypothetical protein
MKKGAEFQREWLGMKKGEKFQWDEEGSKKKQYQGARPRVARNWTVL